LDRITSGMIDVVETAYDVQPGEAGWFSRLLELATPIVDRAVGVAIRVVERPVDGGPIKLGDLYATSNLPPDWNKTAQALYAWLPRDLIELRTRPGTAHTFSELFEIYGELREQLGLSGTFDDWSIDSNVEAIKKVIEVCRDTFVVAATDPHGRGFYLAAPLREPMTLTERERRRWKMVGAHLASGFRLRQGLSHEGAIVESRLPGRAEAVLDPREFRVSDASGSAKKRDVIQTLRDTAVAIDRARGRLRRTDPEESLATWWALLQGRWSLVDWFDTDGRRYVLAHPNSPNIGDPRGLTEREAQVVTFATLGETNKMISYRLGVSESTISRALDSAMHKLHAKTPAQLVERMRGLPTVQTD